MPALRSVWRWRWTPPLALALLPFVVYGRFILGDELANADVFLAYRPAHVALLRGLRQGTVPLWSPYLMGGFPLAFSEYGWFSPLNWAALLVGGEHAGYYLAVAGYVALAGLATYALARRWGASRAGALVAGLVFGQSLFVVGGAPLLNQGAAYWLLPALLWTVEAAFSRSRLVALGKERCAEQQVPRSARDDSGGGPLNEKAVGFHWPAATDEPAVPAAPVAALAGPVVAALAGPVAAVLVGLLLLGSHPQMAVLVGLPVAGYALWLAVERREWRPLATLTVAAALGSAISAVRFLPTLAFVAASTRASGLSAAASSIGSVAQHALLAGLLLPSLSVPRAVTAQWSFYVGPLPLVLATFGVRAMPRSRVVFLGGIGILGVVLALGSYTPIYWIVARTPLLTYFREPSRFLLWSVLAIALLSASGLDRGPLHATRWRTRRLAVLLAAGTVAVAVALGVVSLVLHLFERQFRLSLELRALNGARTRDYPAAHYVASAGAAWFQLVHSANPLRPAMLVPLLALGATAWWLGWLRTSARWRTPSALAFVAVPVLVYGQVRLPAVRPAGQPPVVTALLQARPVESGAAGTTSEADDALAPRVYAWLPLALDNELRLQSQASGASGDADSYRLLNEVLAPNFGLAYGVAQLDGYENLMTREQALLLAALGSERATITSQTALTPLGIGERRQRFGERWTLLMATGTGLLLSGEQLQPQTWPSAIRYQPAIVHTPPGLPQLNGFEVAHPLPRAYVTTRWETADSAEEAIDALLRRAMAEEALPTVITDPAGRLARISAGTIPPGEALAPAAEGQYEARIVSYGDRRVEIETVADREALLILLDANTPGWSASVTGEPVPILPANVAFRAVPIPAGTQRVVFTFTPPHWRAALTITWMATAATALWLVLAGARALALQRERGR